jgi:antitoxin Phd
MAHVSQLQEAKNKFSDLFEAALNHGPQVITGRAGEAVVMLSYEEYRRMLSEQQKLSTFFRESPLVEAELDLTRDTSGPRSDIDRQ